MVVLSVKADDPGCLARRGTHFGLDLKQTWLLARLGLHCVASFARCVMPRGESTLAVHLDRTVRVTGAVSREASSHNSRPVTAGKLGSAHGSALSTPVTPTTATTM